jgi:flavin reductase (DIM6/NTAB) family NADH-FMN oxidoreductase RutF
MVNLNPEAIGKVLERLDPVLWLVTAQAGNRREGMIATFVNQASIVPDLPRIVFGPARQHFTHALIEDSGAFALHLIGEEHIDWVWGFGLQSGRDVDKLVDLAFRPGKTGSPILTDALAWLDCRVECRLDIGDRSLLLAEVVEGQLVRDQPPLCMKRLLQLAPSDKLRELKQQLDRDIVVDRLAIQAFRQSHSP